MRNLSEAVINDAVLPRFFWLVLDIPTYESDDGHVESLLTDLSHCRLKGVRGISDNKQILTNWFGIARNAAIFLEPEKVEPYNDIEQIKYNDPDALCADNLRLLFRIFDKESGEKYMAHDVMQNILRDVKTVAKSIDHNLAHLLNYYGPSKIAMKWEEERTPINDTQSLAKFIYLSLKEFYEHETQDIELGTLKTVARRAITTIGSTYADEGEWVVHSPELIFPMGSTMLVGCDMEAMARYDEWLTDKSSIEWFAWEDRMKSLKTLKTNIEHYGLDRHYKLKFIDAKRWDEMRTKLWNKRETIR